MFYAIFVYVSLGNQTVKINHENIEVVYCDVYLSQHSPHKIGFTLYMTHHQGSLLWNLILVFYFWIVFYVFIFV